MKNVLFFFFVQQFLLPRRQYYMKVTKAERERKKEAIREPLKRLLMSEESAFVFFRIMC